MKIIVKKLQGTECDIEISEEGTVQELKMKIAEEMNIPVSHQKLLRTGFTLANNRTLDSYGIKDGTKLVLLTKKPDTLEEAIHKSFLKFYTNDQADRLTAAFMEDFSKKVSQLSLDDIERFAAASLKQQISQ
ncbi:ubiquitin-like protein 4A [Lutzomyia longipalpis]|uniref:Ubiquitin-like domain-containing protein n=1 Tax=Lutzomyia longipalpis TaxID=7200 RepID=A0A1B0ETS7_LUTLO|nr:ubiquitin-like protein 4A [Lutzomyia longipalpis]